ncbi:MAG: triose-phosphate isomerase [Candidatus Yanofskybacteria bacterium]|nr:triose-phosphate isomerase [Candidatus Yanofskybacteria bacterium]
MIKLIVANWKMAPATLGEARGILETVNEYLGTLPQGVPARIVVCPPAIFLEEVSKLLSLSFLSHNTSLGAQDIFWDEQPANTGEISGSMLQDFGVRYVIVGHSERRWKLQESDETVNKKLKAALEHGLAPIVCLGEQSRDENFKDFLKQQAQATFAGISPEDVSRCLIAYEPVWAISSNPGARPDTPESAMESISVIREAVGGELHFLYGGSIKSTNIAEFWNQEGLEGVLVGGASVNKEEFIKILSLAK